MGNFYVNFTVRSADQGSFVKSLEGRGRKAIVGPTLDETTVFYDHESDESQDEAAIKLVGMKVSAETNGTVLAFLNHDDDILCYWLFQSGKLIDKYNSCPGYFTDGDTAPEGGDARRMSAAFGIPAKADEVESILRDTDYVFALERHEALCRLLGLPWNYLCLGYRYISQGEFPDGVNERDLVRI